MAGLSALFLANSEGLNFEGSCDSNCLLGGFCLPVLPIIGDIFMSPAWDFTRLIEACFVQRKKRRQKQFDTK